MVGANDALRARAGSFARMLTGRHRDWSAQTLAALAPVRAELTIPGSKSLTNRELIIAAIADGPGRLVAPLDFTPDGSSYGLIESRATPAGAAPALAALKQWLVDAAADA